MRKFWTKARPQPIPEQVEFEANQDGYEHLDEIQALNTALCFLCSINADVSEVKSFLCAYPEALLLEGTGRTPEESSRFILLTRTCSCSETSDCKHNRQAILHECIDNDFCFFHDRKRKLLEQSRNGFSDNNWVECRRDLISLEHDIRLWRQEEYDIRGRLWTLQAEKESAARKSTEDSVNSTMSRRPRWIPVIRRRSDEERLIADCEAAMKTLEARRKDLLQEIKKSRVLQFRLLRDAFQVRRHPCAEL